MVSYSDCIGKVEYLYSNKIVPRFIASSAVSSEARFKKEFIAYFNKYYSGAYSIYEIENSEKEPGMPDLLVVEKLTRISWFIELKIASKKGEFKFEYTQPRWYASNTCMQIDILVYVPKAKTFVHISPFHVMKAKKLNFKVEVLDEQYNLY